MLAKFQARPSSFLIIPFVAAFVGWLTNWLAVQMIFYPIQYRGLSLWKRREVPLGLLGWQGIIPCKTRPMTEAMVRMVQTQLLSVQDAFSKLDPTYVATLLAPQVPYLTEQIIGDVAPNKLNGWRAWIIRRLYETGSIVQPITIQFLRDVTMSLQSNITNIFSLQNCVVNQMMLDRSKLGELFKKCGQKELNFLTNSGLWFGFLLGCIQMIVALIWDNPWSLSIGGGIVGYATNWLALKWIFQPIEPIGLFGGRIQLQGMFLRRQKEVAKEFSNYFATQILTAKQLWNTILTDPTTKPALVELCSQHLKKLIMEYNLVIMGAGGGGRRNRGGGRGRGGTTTTTTSTTATTTTTTLEPNQKKKKNPAVNDNDDHDDDDEELFLSLFPSSILAETAIDKYLQQHVNVTYSYMDHTLDLQNTLQKRMEQMTGRQFERVLHPIFEEDELTLIIAGAVLGFIAGFVQQVFVTSKSSALLSSIQRILLIVAIHPLQRLCSRILHWRGTRGVAIPP